MPHKKPLKYNPGGKSLKVPYILYHDLESLLVKTQSSQNNPEKLHTEKKPEHVPAQWLFVRFG